MMISIDLSQEILAIDVFTALEFSLEQRCKDILRSVQLYGDQALMFSAKNRKITFSSFKEPSLLI